ncbi:inositol monophosphatase family protein [Anaerorhabdus sp.]|uniref:inositol monophosphatase family protein n=2 Tax=Anaerorhabdus sp. TaxID=1872524 RepID=UPI002FC8CC57
MENMEMNPKLEVVLEKFNLAKEVVLRIGKELKDKSDIVVESKNNDISDLVTNYDVEVQDKIMNEIKNVFLDDSWLCEENVNQIVSSNLWILDPIDGTTNFISHRRDYTISLAYYHRGKPTFGIVYDVVNDELYHCVVGQGAYCNDQQLEQLPITKMKDSILNGSLKSLLGFYRSHGLDLDRLSKKIRAHRSLGCSSLAICQLALNKEQLFISNHIKLWDYAAARLLLEEVGGRIDIYYTLNAIDSNQTCVAATSDDLLKEFTNQCTEWN